MLHEHKTRGGKWLLLSNENLAKAQNTPHLQQTIVL